MRRWGHVLAAGAMMASGFFVLGPLAGTAHAMQGFGISPTSQEVSAQPGTKVTGNITILNDGDQDVTYKLYATDYTVKDEGYAGNFADQESEARISPIGWFALPAGTAVVKARQQVIVPYTMTVPANATIGGHYGAIFAETIPPPAKGGAQVARVDRLGSLFYIAVGGDLYTKGRIKSFSVPLVQALSPVSATLMLVNDGNIHYAADVTAQLSSPFGKVGHPQSLRGEVLPATQRRFEISLPTGSPIGLYDVKVSVSYMGRIDRTDHWMLLMPRLTFIILSSTVLLVLLVMMWSLTRKLRRRFRSSGPGPAAN